MSWLLWAHHRLIHRRERALTSSRIYTVAASCGNTSPRRSDQWAYAIALPECFAKLGKEVVAFWHTSLEGFIVASRGKDWASEGFETRIFVIATWAFAV